MSFHIDDNTPEVKRVKDSAVARALEKAGLLAEGYAKTELESNPRRIDTGRLRNSITHMQEDEETEIIGTNVEYAPYVHYGTQRMEANEFIKNAIDKHTAEYREVIQGELRKG